jgi:hypothetical protein
VVCACCAGGGFGGGGGRAGANHTISSHCSTEPGRIDCITSVNEDRCGIQNAAKEPGPCLSHLALSQRAPRPGHVVMNRAAHFRYQRIISQFKSFNLHTCCPRAFCAVHVCVREPECVFVSAVAGKCMRIRRN